MQSGSRPGKNTSDKLDIIPAPYAVTGGEELNPFLAQTSERFYPQNQARTEEEKETNDSANTEEKREPESDNDADSRFPDLSDSLPPEIHKRQRKAKKRYRLRKKAYIEAHNQLFRSPEPTSFLTRLKKAANAKTGMEVSKKTVMGLDDVPAAASNLLDVAGPFLLSGAGFYVFTSGITEGISGIIKAYEDEKATPAERYLQISTNALKIALSAAGIAVSGFILTTATLEVLSSFISVLPELIETIAVPATVVGAAPIGVPFLLSIIAGIELFQASTSFHYAKKDEVAAKQTYEETIKESNAHLNELGDEINRLEDLQKEFIEQYQRETEGKLKKAELAKILDNIQQIEALYDDYFTTRKTLDLVRSNYEKCREARLKTERKLGFASADFVLSLVVLALFTMGVVAGLGVAGAASFGSVPGSILIAVVVTIALVKVFEVVDKKLFEGRGTAWIRSTALEVGERVVHAASYLWEKVTGWFHSPTKDHDGSKIGWRTDITDNREPVKGSDYVILKASPKPTLNGSVDPKLAASHQKLPSHSESMTPKPIRHHSLSSNTKEDSTPPHRPISLSKSK